MVIPSRNSEKERISNLILEFALIPSLNSEFALISSFNSDLAQLELTLISSMDENLHLF